MRQGFDRQRLISAKDAASVAAAPFTFRGAPLVPMAPIPIWRLLEFSAERFPDRAAIVFDEFRLTYRGLNSLAVRISAGLQQLGVGPGQRFGICMPNHPSSIVLYYAALITGATVVMLSPLYAKRTIAGQIADCKPIAIATLDRSELLELVSSNELDSKVRHIIVAKSDASDLTETVDHLIHADPKEDVISLRRLIGNGPQLQHSCNPFVDIALIQYSGGTTGAPKGVMLTHNNLHTGVRHFFEMMPNLGFGKEVVLATAPLYHISGMNAVLNPAIGWGATLILVERFEAENVARLCERYSVSYTVGVPTIFFALADYLERASVDWSSLKCAVSGGGYLPESIKTRFENVTKSRLLQAYGLTECSPGVAMPSMSYEDPVGSCGRVLPSTEVQIRSLLDPSIVLPVGEVGEICVRGPQVTPGYWGRDEENKKAFIQGFLRTGDVGRLTEDGVLFLVDRLKEIIICSGFNVYPGLIEEVIFLHPSVSEAIVIGVPDQYRGETVKAFVVLKPGTSLDLQELQTFLRPYVSPVEMPKQLEIRASLPRSEVGKLSRHKLREEIARVI